MIIVHKPGAKPSGAETGFLERHVNLPGEGLPGTALWIDLIEPTREEDRLVETFLGIEIPTRAEMQDIEPSSLLYTENSARYMTARILCHSDTESPKLVPVSFILTEKALVTVRYDEPRSFLMFATRAIKPGGCNHQPEAVLDGLIETIIDRAAEVLRKVGDDIEATSRSVFERAAGAAEKGDAYQKVIRSLGRLGDLISNARESMVSLERMLLFLSANMQRPQRASGFQAEWRTAVRDVQSIEEHANFLNSKITFIHRAEQDHKALLGHVRRDDAADAHRLDLRHEFQEMDAGARMGMGLSPGTGLHGRGSRDTLPLFQTEKVVVRLSAHIPVR
jgi:magnesium transporter